MTYTTAFTREYRSERVAYIAVDGRLTQSDGVTEFARLVQDTLLQRQRIVVDLADVPYIDSSGLAELVHGYSVARAKGGAMKLLRPRGRVDSLLRLTRLVDSFEIYEDEQVAMASFA